MGRNMFWGLALLLVGLLLLASNLGYVEPFSVWGLWPILIIVPTLKFMVGDSYVGIGRHRGNRIRIRIGRSLGARIIALWVLVGAGAQLLHNIGLIPYNWGHVSYWTLPILLVGIGVAIMVHPKRRTWEWTQAGFDKAAFKASFYKNGGPIPKPPFSKTGGSCEPSFSEADGSNVSSFVGDLRFGARPWVFKSPMNLKLWAGDIDMDLTTAQFSPGDNFLTVKAWAGDLDIRVPHDIEVFVEARCGGGDLRVFDQYREGMGVDLKAHRPARAAAREDWTYGAADADQDAEAEKDTGPSAAAEVTRLFIGIDMSFGKVTVR
jgi:predicted membrane protein